MGNLLPRCVLAGLVCIAIAVPGEAQVKSAGRASGPRLVLSETEHDYGRVDPRRDIPAVEIAVRNSGDEPLVLRTIRTSCVCLTAKISATTVPPKGSSTLTLHLQQPAGEEVIGETVVMYSNDPAAPLTKIELTGSVGTAVRAVPTGISVGLIYRGDVARLQFAPVRLVAADGAPLGRVTLTPSHPSIHPVAVKQADGSYEVTATLDETVPLGPMKQTIKVETEHPTAGPVDILVAGVVVGDLDPAGRRVDFGFIKEGQPASVTFLLRNRTDREIDVLSVEPKLAVPADVQVTKEGKDLKVVTRIAGAPAFTRLVGRIDLHTNNPAEPVVTLQVFGGVLGAHPFEQAKGGVDDPAFMTIVKDALARGDRIPADRFFSDVLGGASEDRITAALIRALDEGQLETRMRAVELLAAFKTPRVIERLRLAITDDPEEFVRRRAVAAYADAVGKAALPEVILALQDNEAWVREDAAMYLGKLGDPRAIPALRAASNDPDADTRTAVRDALTSLQAAAK